MEENISDENAPIVETRELSVAELERLAGFEVGGGQVEVIERPHDTTMEVFDEAIERLEMEKTQLIERDRLALPESDQTQPLPSLDQTVPLPMSQAQLLDADKTQLLDSDKTQLLGADKTQLLDSDKTQLLGAGKTQLLDPHRRMTRAEGGGKGGMTGTDELYVPEHADLRERFLFAQAMGGYETVADLLNIFSPGQKLTDNLAAAVRNKPLQPYEVKVLEEYQLSLVNGLINANQYLRDHPEVVFNHQDISQIQALLVTARKRSQHITQILGSHLLHEIEEAVHRLKEFHDKMRQVQRSQSGYFLVDSEVMFIPTEEIIEIVKIIFKGVGNPYVAEKVNGLLLLAARNLLIDIVSFISYYGREQIAVLVRKYDAATARRIAANQVRTEIHKLLAACKSENRLILKRVMDNAERDFELSVEAIQLEAEADAVKIVVSLVPPDPPKEKEEQKASWFDKFKQWLFLR